jgi:hypothetical protein
VGSSRDAVRAMLGAGQLADRSDEASRRVLDAAREVETESRTLDSELDAFLVAMRDMQERRKYERIAGRDLPARITARERDAAAAIADISRGGISLRGVLSDWPGGAAVRITLPGSATPVAARLVRHIEGGAAFAFRQDPESLALIDRALDAITARQAA